MGADLLRLALLLVPCAIGAAGAASTTNATDFHWEHASERWHVLAYAAAALALGWWAWRGYGPTPGGIAGWLARACRVGAMVALVAMVAGPSWQTTSTTVLPGEVLVAVDRSASMARADGPAGRARVALAADLGRELAAAIPGRGLAVDWQGIGLRGSIDPGALPQLAATGADSPLADDLRELLSGGRRGVVVVVTDGRVTSGSSWAGLARELRGRDLALSVLAVGGDTVEPALWIDDVVHNKQAALDETEPVTVRGQARALGKEPILVRLIQNGQVQSQVEAQPAAVEEGADDAVARPFEATLSVSLAQEGPARLRVEVQQGERKDVREFSIEVTKRKLQVLVLADKPRYELRYLREALKRDSTITLHCYLADGKWRQWGPAGPGHLPLTSVELKDYDVIVIGDIGPDVFQSAQLDNIELAVKNGGTGLIWLPGETGAIAGFSRHKLGALLPVELPDAASIARGYLQQQPHRLSQSEALQSSHVLDPGDRPWATLPELFGASPILRVIPGAQVLMQDQDGQPMVVARRYFQGQSLFIAVDDTWRWRRNAGDTFLHRFHSQLLRYVAQGRRLSPYAWRLQAIPRRATPGELVKLALTKIGAQQETAPERVALRLRRADGREELVQLVKDGDGFSARLPAPAEGQWTLEVADGLAPREVETGELEVQPPAGEARDPRADRASLEEFARITGGKIYADPAELVRDLPDVRETRVEEMPPIGLWDTAWALALVVALLSMEWGIRRWNRLP